MDASLALMDGFLERQTNALRLDVFVLEGVVRTGQSSHGRAIYFRRIKMVLQAMKKHKVLDFPSRYCHERQQVVEMLSGRRDANQSEEQQEETQNKVLKKKRKRKEEQWTVESIQSTQQQQQQKTDKNNDNNNNSPNGLVLAEIMVETVLPDIIARIEYACTSLFWELSRGFYLSQNSVCLAALARIRALLMEMGRWLIHDLLLLLPSASLSLALEDKKNNDSEKDNNTTTSSRVDTWKEMLDTVYQYNGEESKDVLDSSRKDLGILRLSLGIDSRERDDNDANNNNDDDDDDDELDFNENKKDNNVKNDNDEEDIGESLVSAMMVDKPTPSGSRSATRGSTATTAPVVGLTSHDVVQEEILQQLNNTNKTKKKKMMKRKKTEASKTTMSTPTESNTQKESVDRQQSTVVDGTNSSPAMTVTKGKKRAKRKLEETIVEKNDTKALSTETEEAEMQTNKKKTKKAKKKKKKGKTEKSRDFFDDIFGSWYVSWIQ